LAVEGTIRHPDDAATREYSVSVEVRDARGEVLARRVVTVGGLKSGDVRTVTLRFEVQALEKSNRVVPAASATGDDLSR